MITDSIKKLVLGQTLEESEITKAMFQIMEGQATPAQIACFLTALRMKGESASDIYAAAKVMREKASHISIPNNAMDLCGTGGDGLQTFNVSTTASFIVAGADIPIAKHGNRGVSSISGSADILEALGVNTTLEPLEVEKCINKIGIGFLFAPIFHKAMKHTVVVRREIGIRTVFNILGPITNPANVKYQLLGVYDKDLTEKLAEVLKRFGAINALVVNGSGLDEITTTEKTKISELKNGSIKTYYLTPEEVNIRRAKIKELKGGTPEENARITLEVLEGNESPYTDITVLNAGAALYISGKASDIASGVEIAKEILESGIPKRKLDKLIEFTSKYNKVLNEASE
ncbi:MAG: anthranilate phosphoribosyltransferase [Candidatus Methanofastidiosum sp.]|nr:anthranilate phosphoribosyltransferase [Methanofastidiosum sp.]